MKRFLTALLAVALFSVLVLSGISLFKPVQTVAAASAPVPNAFSLKVGADGIVTNAVSTNVYQLSSSATKPATKTDADTGNKYISFSRDDDAYYEMSMLNTSGAGTVGFFWDYFRNWEAYSNSQAPSTDISFTWEFTLRFPQMPATGTTFDNVFGYFAGDGGIGFQANSTQGRFIIGNGYTNQLEKGTEKITIPFNMTDNKWYHCILTYDYTTKNLQVYVNGSLIASQTVNELIGTNYTRSSRGFGIGAAPEYITLQTVPYSNDIATFNFSTYSVSAAQVNALYVQAMTPWTAAPVPNGFQMKIAADDTVSNGINSDIYTLTSTTTLPETKTDVAGNKYVSFTEEADTFYEFSMRNNAQKGLFWDYYFNHVSGASNDLSFTWEMMVRLPKMPTGEACILGYYSSESEGGIGLRVNATQGKFVIGDGYGSAFQYCTDYAEIAFDMTANEWYHLILTYDHATKTANAYVNGEAVLDTGVTVGAAVLTHGLWHVRGFGIGTTSGFGQINSVPVANDIAIYNFSTYSVSAIEASLLWEKAEENWKVATPATPSVTPSSTPTETTGPSATPGTSATPGANPIPPTGDQTLFVPMMLVLLIAVAVPIVWRKKVKS